MQEEYLIEKMLKVKSDKELEMEIIQKIIETKRILEVSRKNFEYAENDLIDYYIYQIKANQAKLNYLIRIAKNKGIELSKIDEIRNRIFKNKNIAG